MTDWGSPKVADLNTCTYCALAGFEVRLNRIQCRVLHGHDHYWSRQHCRERCILKAISKVLR